MPDNSASWTEREARRTLARLLPRVEKLVPRSARPALAARLDAHFPRAFGLLHALYGQQYDFFYHLEEILRVVARSYADRPPALKALDRRRQRAPLWFQSEQMLGGACYVDRFAGDLDGVRARIPYFQELGLTYLHLMPLFKTPPGQNDGGYAVSDYRAVDPRLGTLAQLGALAADLRAAGISLVLDFVFNHTADDHPWAQRALAGDADYQAYYLLFDDRTLPDQYERHLREIFPDQAPGSFTYNAALRKWVWTTFHSYQWDLNYANPAVFTAMLGEMLFLANQGVEVLRLDAVAFIWKQMGTACENLPQAHQVIQAFNALARVAAPALVFKSEAIVHPDAVAAYISADECPLSYNPTLMALLWEALATREVALLRQALHARYALAPGCAWVNYVRGHDDIGWSFADEDAAAVGINGFDHRQFLNAFYTGRFSGSFAAGLPFNFNPQTLDMRISGTAASLAGLEQALKLGNEIYIEHALARLLLLHSVILSAGGIPLLYLGDEIATLNDYSYEHDHARFSDSRWAHRPRFDWARASQRHDPQTIPGTLYLALLHLIALRQRTPALAGGQTAFFDTGSPHVLGYVRSGALLALANFAEHPQTVSRAVLAHTPVALDSARDLVKGVPLPPGPQVTLGPYAFMWLVGG